MYAGLQDIIRVRRRACTGKEVRVNVYLKYVYIFLGMGIWRLVTAYPQLAIPDNMDINKCIHTITNKTDRHLLRGFLLKRKEAV